MKSTLALLLLTFSMNSFATGGFYCLAKVNNQNAQVDITISGSTSRMEGNPILDLQVGIDQVSDLIFDVPREQIVGYWNNDGVLKLNALDSEFMDSMVKLDYDLEKNKGSLKINIQGINATTEEINCEFE